MIDRSTNVSAHAARASVQQPVALLYGPGHRIVHGNAPFVAAFGRETIGLPAAEALLDLPPAAFAVLDLVFDQGHARACRLTVRGDPWRMTVAPRRDVETGEVYGVAVRLAPEGSAKA